MLGPNIDLHGGGYWSSFDVEISDSKTTNGENEFNIMP